MASLSNGEAARIMQAQNDCRVLARAGRASHGSNMAAGIDCVDREVYDDDLLRGLTGLGRRLVGGERTDRHMIDSLRCGLS